MGARLSGHVRPAAGSAARIGALAGIDTALWDLFGEVAQRPLVELWGGFRNWLPVNIIGGYYGPLVDIKGEVADEVGEWLEMGFRGCKFKLGSQPVEVDAARVRRVQFRLARPSCGPPPPDDRT